MVDRALDAADGAHQRTHALQGIIFRLDGHQHAVSRRQGVDGEQAQGGGTIDDDKAVGGKPALQRALQLILAIFLADKLHLRRGHADIARKQGKILHAGFAYSAPKAGAACQHLVHGDAAGLLPQAAGGVALRVHIDKQGVLPALGQAGGQVDGRGGFAHAALLIGDGDDLCHVSPMLQASRASGKAGGRW